MAPRTVIFDFDGTLADTIEMVWRILHELAPKFGLAAVSRHEFEQARSFSAREIIKKYKIRWWQLPSFIRQVQDAHQKVICAAPLVEGMDAVVRECYARGCRLGIVSNNREESVRAFLSAHHLAMFHFVATARSLFGKGRLLRRALRAHHLDARGALYIGDETKDIDAAKEAGMRAVAVTWGFNTKELLTQYNPFAVVETPSELLSLLNSIPCAHEPAFFLPS